MRSFPHFIKGTLLLTCAGLLCRFSGFFYKIFLAHALGAEGIGIYQLIFPVFAVCHACTASGIESAISRFTAGAVEKERSYALKAGLFLSLSASVLVCVLLWNQAEFIADKLLCESRCVTPLRILAPVIPLSAIHGLSPGILSGTEESISPGHLPDSGAGSKNQFCDLALPHFYPGEPGQSPPHWQYWGFSSERLLPPCSCSTLLFPKSVLLCHYLHCVFNAGRFFPWRCLSPAAV